MRKRLPLLPLALLTLSSCAHVEALRPHHIEEHSRKYGDRARLLARAAVQVAGLPDSSEKEVAAGKPEMGGMHGRLLFFPEKYHCSYIWRFPAAAGGKAKAVLIQMSKRGGLQEAWIYDQAGKDLENGKRLSARAVKRKAKALRAGR